MGWFIGRYVWKTHQDHAIHPHSKLQAQIMPQIVNSQAATICRLRRSAGVSVGRPVARSRVSNGMDRL